MVYKRTTLFSRFFFYFKLNVSSYIICQNTCFYFTLSLKQLFHPGPLPFRLHSHDLDSPCKIKQTIELQFHSSTYLTIFFPFLQFRNNRFDITTCISFIIHNVTCNLFIFVRLHMKLNIFPSHHFIINSLSNLYITSLSQNVIKYRQKTPKRQ